MLTIAFSGVKFDLVLAQCPATNATNIPSSITISSACPTITPPTGTLNIAAAATVTIQSGGSLTINADTRVRVNGGTVDVLTGGSLDINEDGGTGGVLAIVNGGAVNISSGAAITTEGNVQIGRPNGSSAGSLSVNGTGSITIDGGGNFNLNAQGTVTGDGTISSNSGDINDNGGDSSGFTGEVSCSGSCAPLPVTWQGFGAEILYDGVTELTWKTASELNNEGFYIEKSLNGVTFEAIGFVYGNGTTNEQQTYQFTDELFLQNAYYRLLQVDYDGTSEYSETIFVKHPDSSIRIYPNPVVNQLRLEGNSEMSYLSEVYAVSGELIFQTSGTLASIEGLFNQRLSGLKNGNYLLKLISDEGVLTKQIQKR